MQTIVQDAVTIPLFVNAWCRQQIDVILSHAFTPLDNARLARVCGSMDAHLREIETAFDVTMRRRNEAFAVEGEPRNAQRAVALLQALYERARKPMRAEAFQLALVEALAFSDHDIENGAPFTMAAEPLVLSTRRADLAGEIDGVAMNDDVAHARSDTDAANAHCLSFLGCAAPGASPRGMTTPRWH